MATGSESSVEVSAGASLTEMNASLAVAELGAIGTFIESTPRRAISLEAIESVHLVADHSTPTFAFVGGAIRRIGRNAIGNDFERLGVGLALSLRGDRTGGGVGASLSFGQVSLGGMGLAVHLDAYVFDLGALPSSGVLLVDLGYVASPFTHLAPPPPEPPPIETAPPPAGPPCANEQAIADALARHRKAAVAACNAGLMSCEDEHDRVVVLGADLARCRAGDPVEAPHD